MINKHTLTYVTQFSHIISNSHFKVEPQEDESIKNNPSVKNYFMMAPSAKEKRARTDVAAGKPHPYFRERGLRNISHF